MEILSRLSHVRTPHLIGISGSVQYYLSTLSFNNGKQIEYFHSIILILQQKNDLSGETVYPKIIIFQYMKSLSMNNKLEAFIVPKVIDLITSIGNNGKRDIYTGGNIYGLFCCLEMIEAKTTFTSSVQHFRNFCPSSSTNNDTATIHPVI